MKKCERTDCSVLTSNARYCCRRCASIVNNSKSPKRKRTMLRCSCGDAYTWQESRSRFCLPCRKRRQREREELGNRTLEFYRDKNRQNHPSWKFAEVRAHARRLHAHLPKRCQVCGYDKHTELAHITALSKWPLSTTLNEVNAKTNVLVLCPNHHWEFDNGAISLEAIPSRS